MANVGSVALLSDALKRLISELKSQGISYRQITELTGVDENTIKQFVFRSSRRPRLTDAMQKLASGIVDAPQKLTIEETPEIRRLTSEIANRRFDRYAEYKSQLEELRAFFAVPTTKSEADEMLGPLFESDSQKEICFFSYRRSRIIQTAFEKTKYVLFNRPDLASAPHLFTEIISMKDGLKYRYGIVRSSKNTLILFSFSEGNLESTHIRYFAEREIAFAISVAASSRMIGIDLAIFIPDYKVSDENLGLIDPRSGEGEEAKELLLEFRQSLDKQLS